MLSKIWANAALPDRDGRVGRAVGGAKTRVGREVSAVRHRSHDAWDRYAPARSQIHRPSSRLLVTTAAGSALAAGAFAVVYALRHRPAVVTRREEDYELRLLYDLRKDDAALAVIQNALLAEWGPFAPQDLTAAREMAKRAGKLAFVLGVDEEGAFKPEAILQTARAPVGGDPEKLVARFPAFSAITDANGWRSTGRAKGDTALLLQITSFGERSHGVGSLLRDAALYALPKNVKFALTTTPVESRFDFDVDPSEFPPAVKFHYRGGARPSGFSEAFKVAPVGSPGANAGRQHHPHVVFMRYTRLPDGRWQDVRRPTLQLSKRSRLGWLQEALRPAAPAPPAAEALPA